MATTTASITLSSSDIMDNAVSISNTATLTNQGTDTGMTKTTGLTRLITSATSNVVLIDSGASGGVQTQETFTKGKIFIQNINDRGDGTKYVTILLQAAEIGRLYGGDFMFFPWDANSGEDITLTMSDATETVIEYMVFFE